MNSKLDALARMSLIRQFEERVEEVFVQGELRGTAHTCIGQEAIPVAIAQHYRRGGLEGGGDVITSTHRGHGHFLALGADPRRVMAELFGTQGGYSGGRGGSQLMADYDLGFIGANGIVAGSAAPATGMALAFKQRAEARVAICYLGDGALGQGALHEAMNLAGLWSLPVLFVVEFNSYAMSTPATAALANLDLRAMASSHALEYAEVDGNDFTCLDLTVAETLENVRSHKPTLLRCNTYRQSGHSRGDARIYRSREEEAEWKARDPINRLAEQLRVEGIAEDEIAAAHSSAAALVDDALAFARADAAADPAQLQRGVFA